MIEFIVNIFQKSRHAFGQPKIKVELSKKERYVSRHHIGRIMREQGLVTKYIVAKFKPMKSQVSKSDIGNSLNREFDQSEPHKDAALVYRVFASVKKGLRQFQLFTRTVETNLKKRSLMRPFILLILNYP